jgi:hypothetical protein
MTICAQDCPVHLNFDHMPAIAVGLPRISKPWIISLHKYSILHSVRGSPVIVIMVLTTVLAKHIQCSRRICNPVVYLLAGVHQSREEFKSRPVAGEARSVRDFIHPLKLCGTCAWGSARQLIVKCKYVGSKPPSRNGSDNGKAHPSVVRIVST